MINRQALLKDLQRLLKTLEADLRERCEVAEIGAAVKAEYDKAKEAERTAQSFETWRSDYITQIGAAWILSCVFARFLEDNELVDPPKLSGPGERLQRARDEYDLYVHEHPADTVREYLLSVFDALAKLPGAKEVFGGHNLIHQQRTWLSGDAAKELRNFWQQIDPETGELIHDFTDPQWDTRFLGDLYQDLSEAARKKYALLQTPEFVEEFILERTLEPALDEFGLEPHAKAQSRKEEDESGSLSAFAPLRENLFRMIDPACGSGHFLLGSFDRILNRWQKKEPGTNTVELVQRTLHSIHGVDVNPYAVAIARFRLLVAAMKASNVARLADTPIFKIRLACGDSLLHGSAGGDQLGLGWGPLDHVYETEDRAALRRILVPQTYHAVVGNPPYINVKDRALNEAYRSRYGSCYGKFALTAPFLERFFNLALEAGTVAGYVGLIIGNGFMKQQFGRKVIEEYIPRWEVTHVIDTAGAYLPGHGTPTAIILGRPRRPSCSVIRAAMGIQGEPGTPDDPAKGKVWESILDLVDHPGSKNNYISVEDAPRTRFHSHPWSIGGGGAAELKEMLDKNGGVSLSAVSTSIGIVCFTLEDDMFFLPWSAAKRRRLPSNNVRAMVVGEVVRHWVIEDCDATVFPYDEEFRPITPQCGNACLRYLWHGRTCLSNNKMFGRKTKIESGLRWYEFGRLTSHKLKTPLSLVFANVVTHNHFVLDRGGKIFNSHAPLIKLAPDKQIEDYYPLLGLLNSSTVCFWLKQVCHNKGSTVDEHGARKRTIPFEDFFEVTSTALGKLPVPDVRNTSYAEQLDRLGSKRAEVLMAAIRTGRVSVNGLNRIRIEYDTILAKMVSQQEELDWHTYHLYALTNDVLTFDQEPPHIQLGQRAFEIVLARKMEAGEVQTTWFERHGSTPITELPADWPDDYKKLVERRIEVIESNPQIALIEQPEYKRRWNTEPWDSQVERALRCWLLDRLESYFDFDGRMNDEGKATAHASLTEPRLISTAQLADIARDDDQFMEVGEVYRDRKDFDVTHLVADLVADESVPLLPVLRYKPAGLRKREQWEATWELQRQEDAGEEVADIPVPPKYKSSDFISTGGAKFWKLRGKLDVPKERWVSFPHCEGEDQSLVVAWAGYDHLQLTKAIAAFFADVQEKGGSDDPRLVPLLGCILELNPWVKQWHNDVDPDFGYRLGDYFANFVEDEARTLGKTVDDIRAWQPPAKKRKRKKKA